MSVNYKIFILDVNTLFYGASNDCVSLVRSPQMGMASRPDMDEELCSSPNAATSDWLRESITWKCLIGGILCHKTNENLNL